MKSEKYHPRALDLNAPILSTRRPPQSSCCISKASSRRGVRDGIPFSWEQAPGKPKTSIGDVAVGDSTRDADTPRPRPPPRMVTKPKGYGDGGDISSLSNEEDVFSNAVDVFSLSEAIDILEREERPDHRPNDNIDQLKLRIAESSGGDLSPNFMINRFLPDASALASAAMSSALTNYHHHPSCSEDETKDLSCCTRQVSSSCRYKIEGLGSSRGSATTQASGAQKGCGMENLFLWRMKPRFCGVQKASHVQPFATSKPKNM
ncbi:uncharacterized protein LOC125315834 [Rhodamnia argentea]|uniref:Uncharacterized protein LOC125315834 n=1 Tax=Rhodamnia argentea TaxID=178133 RepID=A0ABM3HMB3_9MYRT|nr:uncharacterized protein LOC125315834 [Rhodamnia argentea]